MTDELLHPLADDYEPDPEAMAALAATNGHAGPPVVLRRVDMGPAFRGERREPDAVVLERSDGMHLFPAGINYIFGDSGDGKSFVALMAALQLIRSDMAVVWVTYEDPNELVLASRFKSLGGTEDDLTKLHVIIPADPWSALAVHVAHYCRREQAAFLVLDSIGEALALDGVNEDSDAEFGPWARKNLRHVLDVAHDATIETDTAPCKALAILPIDHATKSKSSPHFPSGTKRKRAMVTGLMVSVDVRQPFGIGVVGRVNLVCSKDRGGRFRRGEIAAEVMMDATEEVYRIEIDAPPADRAMTSSTKRKAEDRVLAVITDTNVELSVAEVERIANSPEHTLPGEGALSTSTVRNALTRLAKRPNVTKTSLPGPDGRGFKNVYRVSNPDGAENAP